MLSVMCPCLLWFKWMCMPTCFSPPHHTSAPTPPSSASPVPALHRSGLGPMPLSGTSPSDCTVRAVSWAGWVRRAPWKALADAARLNRAWCRSASRRAEPSLRVLSPPPQSPTTSPQIFGRRQLQSACVRREEGVGCEEGGDWEMISHRVLLYTDDSLDFLLYAFILQDAAFVVFKQIAVLPLELCVLTAILRQKVPYICLQTETQSIQKRKWHELCVFC